MIMIIPRAIFPANGLVGAIFDLKCRDALINSFI